MSHTPSPEPSSGAEPPRLADEIRKMQAQPLLPVEKKLIVWSVSLGIVLLVLLAWVSKTFFAAP